MFKKLSQKIGLTETEAVVILFLAGIFILGYVYKEFFKEDDTTEYKNFDYSKEDSSFAYYSNASSKVNPEDSSVTGDLEIKREILELNDTILYENKSTIVLTEKSINLNSATVQELILLPGIGEKTAEKIIILRNERGGFKRIEEIMDVHGIGEIKFNKIKKFLYIE
jgi:competence ComEA-like helix-hairpin-helix protein